MNILTILIYLVAFVVGAGIIPFLIYSRMMPSVVGDRIGNGLLTLIAIVRGGNQITETETGNYELEDYNERLMPEKNHDQLHNSPFALTFDKKEGTFGSSVVVDGPGEDDVAADGGGIALVDKGKGYADISDVDEGHGELWVKLNTYTQSWKNLGTTGPIQQAEQEGKVEHGGNTAGMSEKLRVISMFGGLVLGAVIGYMMFGGAL